MGQKYTVDRVIENGIQTYAPGMPISDADAQRLGAKTADSPAEAVMAGYAEPGESVDEEAVYVDDGNGTTTYPGSGPQDGVTDPRADVAPTEHAKAGVLEQHAEIIKQDIKEAEEYPADLGPVTSPTQKTALEAAGEEVAPAGDEASAADPTGEAEDLMKLTKAELQAKADSANVAYASGATKADLVTALEKHAVAQGS